MTKALAEALDWVKGFYETRDHDDVNKNWPYNLQAWRAEGYLIIYQGAPHGLYVLRTPSGENQVASHDLNITKAAAQADFLPKPSASIQEADHE